MLTEWEKDYELLYYQRRTEWLHLVRPCVHAITHAARETFRRGPLNISAQWALENTIGNLGREVHQFSNPFSNLAERGALRARMIALYALIPDLDPPPKPVRGSISLGDSFTILQARSRTKIYVPDVERNAFKVYFEQIGVPTTDAPVQLHKWARLRLPNSQVARSAWKENERREPRNSRNVKVSSALVFFADFFIECAQFLIGNDYVYGEVYYYCHIPIEGKERALALVSVYSAPHPILFEESCRTLRVCRHNGVKNLHVIDVKAIDSVIGMIPFPLTDAERSDAVKVRTYTDCYYVAEKLVIEKLDEDVAAMT
ncbi:hypothetical protein BDN72DRAFT_772154 [Pluteus cervinus]|uniref:Uncharacterized protein n=1 Tax=Pluteus cervinus TaxID=181527 RepID=A0ACD3AL44_9AGAR|nr:hypothetical protein BDN72DRAFT_772154 [Pluteus cervinus]